MKKRVAVVGAGIYGTTIAIKLSTSTDVDLYEHHSDILAATSGINEYRIHRGYHYPRSPETVASALESEVKFKRFYKQAVISSREHYYSIAKNDTLTTAKEYINFCNKFSLKFNKIRLDFLNNEKIALTVKANESLYDPIILRKLVWQKLKKSKVNVLLRKKFTKRLIPNYDKVIISTYSNINELLDEDQKKKYQYEICEKPIVKLPNEFRNKSIVIMDGPFMCIDPYRKTQNIFVMGNVIHAIHSSNIDYLPIIPTKFKEILNHGIIKNPSVTNFNKFIDSGSVFMPGLKKARHIGSMFTIRTVLPHKEKTDERPTIVRKVDKKLITVFSGKVANCISAAEEVSKLI